jgi:hypothetical protein
MRRRVNRILLATLLGLYGIVSLSGPALHGLPGLGHAAAKLGTHDEASPAHGDREGGSSHDCPICHFHSQGQFLDNSESGPGVDVVRTHLVADIPLTCPIALHSLSSPRAPPVA